MKAAHLSSFSCVVDVSTRPPSIQSVSPLCLSETSVPKNPMYVLRTQYLLPIDCDGLAKARACKATRGEEQWQMMTS